MTHSSKLETYLANLDKALGQISVSEKAEIIIEIKSHILEAQNEEQDLDAIFASLGEPEQVANRYLSEKGLKPQKAPKTQMGKWLIIGFLGTLSIFIITFFILIMKFTPLIKIDESKGRVKILGGLIDINSDNGTIKMGSKIKSRKGLKYKGHRFKGSKLIDKSKFSELKINFANGKIKLKNSSDNYLRWECKAFVDENDFIKESNNKLIIKLYDENDFKYLQTGK